MATDTKITEQKFLTRLLLNLKETRYLPQSPLIRHRERPDFLLECDDQNIGLEVTQATSPELKQYQHGVIDKLSDTEKPDYIEPGHFGYDSQLTFRDMQELPKCTSLTGAGKVDSQVEVEWFRFVIKAIVNKAETFGKKEFEKFDQNWLLIDDETPCVGLDRTVIEPICRNNLSILQGINCFDKILILTGWHAEDTGSVPGCIVFSTGASEVEFLVKPR